MAFGVGSRRWLVVLLAATCGFWQTGDAFSQSKLSPGYAAGDAGLTPSQRAGREIWFFATAFNYRFYTYSYPQRLGAAIVWYLVLAAKNKGDLFLAWGGISDLDCCVPGATNFVKVERRLPPEFTQENLAVGWYSSSGSLASDRAVFHTLAENLSAQFEKNFPEYHKVSEGETKAGFYEGYEFRFEAISRNTAKGDLRIWGRTIFLPPSAGQESGVVLLMLTTSLAPELKSVDDVGVKGELPMILESFRFGKK